MPGDEALESFKRSIEINDKWSTSFYVCGEVLWELEQKEAALAHYMKALELAPNSFRFQEKAGWVLKELNHHKEAIPYYEKALELNPELEKARETLEMLQETIGKE